MKKDLVVALILLFFQSAKTTDDLINRKRKAIIENRIYNGAEVDKDQCQYFVRINGPLGDLVCGGTLVAPNIVLTAAHCTNNTNLVDSGFFVEVWGASVEDGNIAQITKVRQHDNFEIISNYSIYTNDVALLQVNRSFNSTYVVELKKEPLSPYDQLTIIGQGVTESGSKVDSNTLLKTSVKYIPNNTCSEIYSEFLPLDDTMLCAWGGDNNIADACSGDSGGPAIDAVDGCNGQQVGITSFGPLPCGSTLFPGVYCRISTVFNWIRSNICDMISDKEDEDGVGVDYNKPWFCNECGDGNPRAKVSFYKNGIEISRICDIFRVSERLKEYCNSTDLTDNRSPIGTKIKDVCVHECNSNCSSLSPTTGRPTIRRTRRPRRRTQRPISYSSTRSHNTQTRSYNERQIDGSETT